MSKEEQIIIDEINIFDTLDNWADLISQEWCSGEYPVAEIMKNYILDINEQLARKTQLSIKQSKELIRLRKELQESTIKNRNLKQECDNWKHQAELGSETTDRLSKQLEDKTHECEDLKLILQQSKDNNKSTMLLLSEKNEECEELKSESFTREELITLQEKDIECYRNALDEIEEYSNTYFDKEVSKEIFDIISKVKVIPT